jgi:hypothetical protein
MYSYRILISVDIYGHTQTLEEEEYLISDHAPTKLVYNNGFPSTRVNTSESIYNMKQQVERIMRQQA